MRIAYVSADPGVPIFGRKGSSIHVQEVVRGLLKQGAEIDLFTTRVGGEAPPDLQALRVHRLPSLPKGDLAAREQAALATNDSLRASLEREEPLDMVYERYSLWSFAGMEYARQQRIPGLLEVNTPLIEEQARYRGLVDRAAAERVAQRAFAAASALLGVSSEVVDYLRPYAGERAHLVPNGADPSRFSAGLEPAYPKRRDEFTIGFVGTLKPWHGLFVLADAFSVLHRRAHCAQPNVRLLIVGDGDERAALQQDFAARGLQASVHFTGAVAPESVPGWLASMDVAVAPYPDLPRFYFSPLKIYEYMAAGVPVVASRIGQLNGLIQDGVNGLLCRPGDSMALATALDCLRWDPDLRFRLARAARAAVLEKHTWDIVARRILELAGFGLRETRFGATA